MIVVERNAKLEVRIKMKIEDDAIHSFFWGAPRIRILLRDVVEVI